MQKLTLIFLHLFLGVNFMVFMRENQGNGFSSLEDEISALAPDAFIFTGSFNMYIPCVCQWQNPRTKK